MKVHLETARLVLREFTNEDAGLLMDLDSDPEVVRYINGGLAPNFADQEVAIQRILEGYLATPGYGFFVALEKLSLEFIGWFHFRPDRRFPEFMEIGYRLKKSAWGRGLATEGSQALIDQGRARGLTLFSGCAMKANHASIHVLEKVGLKLYEEYQEQRFPGEDKTAVHMRS